MKMIIIAIVMIENEIFLSYRAPEFICRLNLALHEKHKSIYVNIRYTFISSFSYFIISFYFILNFLQLMDEVRDRLQILLSEFKWIN